jgi:hypothetical protein
VVQALLSVTQPVGLMAAQVPPAQLPLQQEPSPLQVLPFWVQAVPQCPVVSQRSPQHCTGEVQGSPGGKHPPITPPSLLVVEIAQVPLPVSQTPTQQPEPHGSPSAEQLALPSATPLMSPMSPLPLPVLSQAAIANKKEVINRDRMPVVRLSL